METILKQPSTKEDFKVVQKDQTIESINKLNQVFHFIDLKYLSSDILFHGWIGYRTNDQIKEVLDGHFSTLHKQHKCSKMLIENTNMSGTFSGINEWLANDFMPKMIRNGLKYNAVVLPQNVFAQLAVQDWDKKVGGFTTRNFGSVKDAVSWLKTVQ